MNDNRKPDSMAEDELKEAIWQQLLRIYMEDMDLHSDVGDEIAKLAEAYTQRRVIKAYAEGYEKALDDVGATVITTLPKLKGHHE